MNIPTGQRHLHDRREHQQHRHRRHRRRQRDRCRRQWVAGPVHHHLHRCDRLSGDRHRRHRGRRTAPTTAATAATSLSMASRSASPARRPPGDTFTVSPVRHAERLRHPRQPGQLAEQRRQQRRGARPAQLVAGRIAAADRSGAQSGIDRHHQRRLADLADQQRQQLADQPEHHGHDRRSPIWIRSTTPRPPRSTARNTWPCRPPRSPMRSSGSCRCSSTCRDPPRPSVAGPRRGDECDVLDNSANCGRKHSSSSAGHR